MNGHGYLVIVERAPHNYSAYSPDLPGCAAVGDTYEGTLRLMREVMEGHLELMREEGCLSRCRLHGRSTSRSKPGGPSFLAHRGERGRGSDTGLRALHALSSNAKFSLRRTPNPSVQSSTPWPLTTSVGSGFDPLAAQEGSFPIQVAGMLLLQAAGRILPSGGAQPLQIPGQVAP
jgi:predicted RNase H-like HicB family nuclease